jgi:hypothetical protein
MKNFTNKAISLLVACGAVAFAGNSVMAQSAEGVITFQGEVVATCAFDDLTADPLVQGFAETVDYVPATGAATLTLEASSTPQLIVCNTDNTTLTLAVDNTSPVLVPATDYNHTVDIVLSGGASDLAINADIDNLTLGVPNTVNADFSGAGQDVTVTSTITAIAPATQLPVGIYGAVLTYTVTPN